jgi:hypothetical protein
MPDLHDQHHIGRLDAIDHAVVADAETAGASEAVAQGFAELEWVGGELGFDGATDLAFGRLGERNDGIGGSALLRWRASGIKVAVAARPGVLGLFFGACDVNGCVLRVFPNGL